MQMVAPASTAALFMMAGALQQRLHTRDGSDGRYLGAGATDGRADAVLVVASLGMPGPGTSSAKSSCCSVRSGRPRIAFFAAFGMVVAAVYARI
jgi:NADH-quinone oxidoreductase subunit M